MQMSFLGSIGHLMSNSGVQGLLETVYVENAVPHMLNGKAISRGIRGHSLAYIALHSLFISQVFHSDSDVSDPEGQSGTATGKHESGASGIGRRESSTSEHMRENVEETSMGELHLEDSDITDVSRLFQQLLTGNLFAQLLVQA